MTSNSFISSLYEDIRFMVNTMVVKMNEQATIKESFDSVINYERYRSVLRGTFKASSMLLMDEAVVTSVIGDMTRVYQIIANPSVMTTDERIEIDRAHAEKILLNFEELNDYYRQYVGLPDVADKELFYITDIPNVRTNVPIHKLNNDELTIITNNGRYKHIVDNNPTKTYLKYIGPYRMDIVAIREANQYDIIKIETPENALTKDLFVKEYIRARRYILATSYDPGLFQENDFYEGIMGIVILTQAIRNCLSVDPIVNSFYNIEVMDAILRSYGIEQYFKGLPILYKRRLIQNLDHILSYKGTDTVLLDICKIFGYDNIKINRYYLLKTHNKSDDTGEFIFPRLPDQEFDYDQMYNLEFLKSDIGNGSNVSINRENIISYETVTNRDPLWQMTDQEIVSLKKENFNLKMSDYISIEAAYNVSQLLFELSYFINFLLDSRNAVSSLLVTNKYSYDGTSDLFTTITMLMALTAKKIGFDGNINSSPLAVAKILKFNLEDVEAQVAEIISQYKLNIKVSDVLLARPSVTFTSQDSVVNMYIKNSNIYDLIEERIKNAKSIHEFNGFNRLKKTLFISSMLDKIFTKKDGSVAGTYWEMLNDLDSQLGSTVTGAEDKDQIDALSLYILNQLQTFFNTDKLNFLFINTPDMHEKLIKVYFKQAVELFKYMDTQLDSIDIFFKMDDEASNVRIFDEEYRDRQIQRNHVHVIEDIVSSHKTIFIEDGINFNSRVQSY